MMADIRLPKITAPTLEQKMVQVQSYMYQLVEQLNYSLNTIDKAISGDETAVDNATGKELTEKEAQSTFQSIKSLIIKSADIVEAYYDVLVQQFDGLYVAISDFGTYKEETSALITQTSSYMQAQYNTLAEIISDIQNSISDTSAWIRSGLLDWDDDIPIYGVEVGQRTQVGGVEVFNKYARFTADGIYFYVPGVNDPVAKFTGTSLSITNAVVAGNLRLGGYLLDTTNGLAFKWVGATSSNNPGRV